MMARTNFAELLRQLELRDKLVLSRMLGTRQGRHAKFGEDDPLLVQQGTTDTVRLAEWWLGLMRDEDLLTQQDTEDNSRMFHGLSDTSSMSGITGPSDIGVGGVGAILELRKLKSKVPPDKWGDIAEAVGQAVKFINDVDG